MSVNLPSPSKKLAVALNGPVATLAIDNPQKRNAIDLEMWKALPSIMHDLTTDERVRVVVIRGAGGAAFASGADISEFHTVRADAAGSRLYEAANEAAFWAVAHCPKPVIAMIRGFCLGGGFGLALACDMRVAEERAVFGIPAARLGVGYPPGAMALIVSVLGPAVAKDLLFTARRIDASEAQRMGVVQQVVADQELDSAVLSLAETIAANAPLTIRAAKAAIDAAAGLPRSPGAPSPLALADTCFDSGDYREGRRAFLEKRLPIFSGR